MKGRKDIYTEGIETRFPHNDPTNGGRPKKLYTDHINDMKAKGYQPPTKTEYFDMVGLLLAMEEEDLKQFASDKSRPYWIRLIIIDMNAKNTRQKMMSDYRDWLFGRDYKRDDAPTNQSNVLKVEIMDYSKNADKTE